MASMSAGIAALRERRFRILVLNRFHASMENRAINRARDARRHTASGGQEPQRGAWSGRRESNPRSQLGRLELYH